MLSDNICEVMQKGAIETCSTRACVRVATSRKPPSVSARKSWNAVSKEREHKVHEATARERNDAGIETRTPKTTTAKSNTYSPVRERTPSVLIEKKTQEE